MLAASKAIVGSLFNPYSHLGAALAARYDLSDPIGYTIGTGVKLLRDKSGNSEVNVLALNGAGGNYASSPDSSAISFPGDRSIICYWALNDYTPGAPFGNMAPGAQWGAAGNRSWGLEIAITTGQLQYFWSVDGTAALTANSTVNLPAVVADFQGVWIKVDHDVDNGASGNDVKFYTSFDGINYTQLGATVTGVGTTSVFNSTGPLEIGSRGGGLSSVAAGLIYRFRLLNGIGGTLVFDADFTRVAKLAASFSEFSSNAATVTINTSGDLGARICGARDLVQLTGSKQPTISGGGALFDGSNDFMQAASFALLKPATVYFLLRQIGFSNGVRLFDGSTADSSVLQQINPSPNLQIYAGSAIGPIAPAVGADAIVTALFNGAGSILRLNKSAPTFGDTGVGSMNGFTLGSSAGGANNSNVSAKEIPIFTTAHDASTQNRVVRFLAKRGNIAIAA